MTVTWAIPKGRTLLDLFDVVARFALRAKGDPSWNERLRDDGRNRRLERRKPTFSPFKLRLLGYQLEHVIEYFLVFGTERLAYFHRWTTPAPTVRRSNVVIPIPFVTKDATEELHITNLNALSRRQRFLVSTPRPPNQYGRSWAIALLTCRCRHQESRSVLRVHSQGHVYLTIP